MRRWPSLMKTTARITPRMTIGSERRWKVLELTQACTATGTDVRIEAKISSEMPLPTPRCVISSPIHISSVVPAVRVSTISRKERTVRSGRMFDPPMTDPLWNRKT